jgi:hypothetical protein
MYAQLDLKMRYKRPQKKKDHLIFIKFGIKKFIEKNNQKEKL